MDIRNNIANQEIIKLARGVGLSGDRTVGIIAKSGALQPGDGLGVCYRPWYYDEFLKIPGPANFIELSRSSTTWEVCGPKMVLHQISRKA
jgi:hypothetical protein